MNFLGKNTNFKNFVITTFIILAIFSTVFNFIGATEAATDKNTSNGASISKNIKIKTITISNDTKGGIKGAVNKSKNGTIIYLKKGVYKFNNANIKINKTLTIVGKGSVKNIIIDAREKGRIFNINKYGKLKLINVTIKKGLVSSNRAKGGAIYNKGSLYINNCIFIKNRAEAMEVSFGGAIYNIGSLEVKNSVFKKCFANFGGTIYCSAKYTTHVSNCKFLDNWEGTIYNEHSSKIILKNSHFKYEGIVNWNDNSQIINNKFNLFNGLAIENYGDYVTISHNTISGRVFQGIYSEGSKNKIQYNKIYELEESYNSAILLEGHESKVNYNKIFGFEIGIHIIGNNNMVIKNQLYGKNKGVGISIDYSNIFLEGSMFNKVTKNIVSKFDQGIYIYKGLKTNKISYNKLIKNTIALSSSYAFKNKSNIFIGNKINIKRIKDRNNM